MPRTTTADNVEIEFGHLGGSGRPLLFSHATGFCSTVWRPVVDELADQFSCWAFDARAHGRSGRPDDEVMSWQAISQDVTATVNAMAAQGVDTSELAAVGHSMGGAINILAELSHPGTFRFLWAFEPIIFPETVEPFPPGPNFLADGARRRRHQFDSAAAARDNFAAKPPMAAFDPAALDGYLDHGLRTRDDGSVELACDPNDEARCYEMGPPPGGSAQLASLRPPLTVVVGHDSGPGPSRFGPAIVEAVAGSTLERQSEMSHFGPMEDPRTIAASIARAFAS